MMQVTTVGIGLACHKAAQRLNGRAGLLNRGSGKFDGRVKGL